KAACAAPAHWCANTCSAQRTADERAHELLSWSRHVRERLPGRTPDARRRCGGATRLGHRPPDRAPLAILGRGRCRPRRATRMPDGLDSGPGRDALARPSPLNALTGHGCINIATGREGGAVRKTIAVLGSVLFFAVAPSSVAGLVPWWITRWEFRPPFFDLDA